MADETTEEAEAIEGDEPETSGQPLSGPVSGFVDTVHTPKRDSIGTVGEEYLEGVEKGYIGERTDEAPDDSVYQAPTDGEHEEPKTSFPAADTEREAQAAVEVQDPNAPAVEDMTKAELQDELRERDLPVSGNKDELQDRLADDDAGA